ncbi:hypothetical protein [Methanoplanus limicola]|uniref:Uncharacterized protein n=1 Tax=Methanoplanus limicola DSM 2279 TaxID=937775 RepID=H1Z1F7_9EURY|nr:hypothetical protein [Methanoplanus limicola]EHQ36304.1 hypothetical protein Metlim_2245 [Methanoplanus limicola DSM 2279]
MATLQYVYDSKGNKTGVIIPIEIWDEEEMKIRDDIEFRPQDFRGIYKNIDLDLDEDIRNLRDEWVREC